MSKTKQIVIFNHVKVTAVVVTYVYIMTETGAGDFVLTMPIQCDLSFRCHSVRVRAQTYNQRRD